MANVQSSYADAIARGPASLQLRRELRDIKPIAVEEHIAYPELFKDSGVDNHASQKLGSRMGQISHSYPGQRVRAAGDVRIQDMDDNGVALQVLGLTGAINSTHITAESGQAGVIIAKQVNDRLKQAVDANPTRFKAFAELPFHVPSEAVAELHRCIKKLGFVGAMLSGSVGGDGRFLDAPEFDPVLSAFEELDVPLFLHPGVPVKQVWDAYYNIPGRDEISVRFGLGGWGWHNEVAVHVLRLALSGTLERHPRLKIIIGHQGEMLPSMLQRVEQVFDAQTPDTKRSVAETLRSQVWISVSGFFSLSITQATIAAWGMERVLFGVDYPFSNMNKVPEYIRGLGQVVSPADLRKILQTNAEKLLKITASSASPV